MIFLLVPAAFIRGKGVYSNTVAGCHAIPIVCRIVRTEATKQSQVLSSGQTIMKFRQLLALCCHYVVSDQVFKKCCDKMVVYKVERTCLYDMVVFEYLRQT